MENAGRLEPGATYVYERHDGVVYARKFGDPPNQRFEIGRDYDSQSVFDDLQEARLWGEIHRAAKTNPALQDAVDRVKLVYALGKQDDSISYHPG
jgi:hypothetical protein